MNFKFFEHRGVEEPKQEKFKQEELKPKVEAEFKPIIACLINDNERVDPQTEKTLYLIKKDGQSIDYYANKNFYELNNMRNSGKQTYVVSECNDKDKYSKRYCNCTGVILVGKDKNSNKQISFMSHQDPWKFLTNKKEEFTKDIIESIKKIKNETNEKSIDAIIFGGNAGNDEYKNSIKLLGDIITKELNFEPTVMTGPNMNSWDGPTNVYFDTQNRRLYIERPPQESEHNENYLPSELEEKSTKW